MDDTKPDMSVRYVHGLATGMVIQFGTGEWRDGSVKGPAISEAAFDLLEPAIRSALPDWAEGARYAVTAIPTSCLKPLINAVRELAGDDEAAKAMINAVADWLSEAADNQELVSIFGI